MSDASSPHQAADSSFGFSEFRPGQEEIVARGLTGENVLAVMPTGSGKSLATSFPDRPPASLWWSRRRSR